MRIVLDTYRTNTKHLSYNSRNLSFRSIKNLVDDVGGSVTGYARLKELSKVETEAQGWKVAMKMADYGNPARHAAWVAAGTKGAAIGSIFGPVGATICGVACALAANYACNKVRNKVLDKAADWLEGE